MHTCICTFTHVSKNVRMCVYEFVYLYVYIFTVIYMYECGNINALKHTNMYYIYIPCSSTVILCSTTWCTRSGASFEHGCFRLSFTVYFYKDRVCETDRRIELSYLVHCYMRQLHMGALLLLFVTYTHLAHVVCLAIAGEAVSERRSGTVNAWRPHSICILEHTIVYPHTSTHTRIHT